MATAPDEDDAAAFFAQLDSQNGGTVGDSSTNIDDGAADFFATLDKHSQQHQEADSVPESSAVAVETKAAPTAAAAAKAPESKAVKRKRESDAQLKEAIQKAKDREKPKAPIETRIVGMLVPDMTVPEVMALIRKMKSAGKSELDEFSAQDAEHKTAPRFICDYCGNTDQNNFVTDYARGDTICCGKDGNGCGTVVQDHIVFEGSAYRKFEGEEDKSHHGPAPNKLFSSGHNLRTTISMEGTEAANLRRAANYVEMNLSQMGKDERRTRIGYKDQMKKEACSKIDHVAANLDLHELVVSRSKKMFAEFRDVREHVHQFEAIVAGCILSAYLDTQRAVMLAQSKSGRQTSVTSAMGTKPPDEKALHPFQCPHCKMQFNAIRGLQFHKCELKPDSKSSNSEGSAAPSLQPMEAPDAEVKGTIEIKDGRKWFKCPICSRLYGKSSTLDEHLKRHAKQSKKRKTHIELGDIDTTRLAKTNVLASANPSVQVNQHEKVLFRGGGRRPWLKHLQEGME